MLNTIKKAFSVQHVYSICVIIVVSTLVSCNSTEKKASPIADTGGVQDTIAQDETFNQISNEVIDKLNKDIIALKLTDIEKVVNLYKPKEAVAEGKYSYTMSTEAIDNQTVEITLIEAGLLDDAVEGVKSVIVAKKDSDIFQVVSIKENYRCYRGHQEWSAEKCL